MNNELLIVDEDDNVIGYGEKMAIHRAGQLHRAFSVFIYDFSDGTILIQKRAEGKYHSGGKLSNSCCSHQYKGETFEASVNRCVMDELGLELNIPDGKLVKSEVFLEESDKTGMLIEMGKFMYYSNYGGISEHEIDHVVIYGIRPEDKEKLKPNPEEVEYIEWMKPEVIDEMLRENRDAFSSWFDKAYDLAKKA